MGGSRDGEDTALAVAPKSSSPWRVVRTVTPPHQVIAQLLSLGDTPLAQPRSTRPRAVS